MIKDSPFVEVKNNTIEINHGRRFPLAEAYPVYVFLMLVFLVSFWFQFTLLSVTFMLVSLCVMLILITSYTGLYIEDKNRMKFFMSVFYIKWGEWRKYRKFNCLVLKTSSKVRENSIVSTVAGDAVSVKEKFKTTELYLMDRTHRMKVLCGSFNSYSKAKEFAKELSGILDYPIEKFSPQRLSKTRR